MKRLAVLVPLAAVVPVLALLFQCDDKGTGGGKEFEVHEWGVVIVTDGDSSGFVTCRPQEGSPVREPVIYFQGDMPNFVSVKATFNTGSPTETFPPAMVADGRVEWDTVWHLRPILKPTAVLPGLTPFDSVKDVLGMGGGNSIRYKDDISTFLYYEGTLNFTNQITATWDLDSLMVHLTNTGSYPVYNLVVSIAGPMPTLGPTPITYQAVTLQVLPGETADLLLSSSVSLSFLADLMTMGFTRAEAGVFDSLWRASAFHPFDQGATANLIYRVPQSVYDSLITFEVKPVPNRTIRALYALIHIR
jgi:hypothetical protein